MLEQTDILADFEENKGRTKVHVNLPKFKIESSHDQLKDVLEALGMTEMFRKGFADFTDMADWARREKLHVDQVTFLPPKNCAYHWQVIQKAMIEVNEEGTIAAAASAVIVRMSRSARIRPKEFNADHPFIFFLRDLQTGMLLFQGRVLDPTA